MPIPPARIPARVPVVRARPSLLVLGGLLVLSAWRVVPAAAAADAPTHYTHRAVARAAYERKDYPAALAATEAALALRPDSPRYLHNLAALQTLTGARDAALATLRRLAGLGVYMPVERDPDFAALQGSAPFAAVVSQLASHREPRGAPEVFAELPGRTGILEGLAYRPRTGDLFLSDVHHRCIWRRDADGRVTRFSAEDDELLGVFGLALDEARDALWAATAALPEMAGYTPALKGAAALAEFSLSKGELRRVVHVPADGRDHALGDVVVAPDGTVYATDSKAPVVWQLAPGAEEMEKLSDNPAFGSLQGMVLRNRELIVADYGNGLFALELPEGRIRAFAPPAGTTLLGIDGLALAPEGLVATQNGVTPTRILHLALAPDASAVTRVDVLAAGGAALADVTTIALVGDRPTFIAGAGWDGFDVAKAKQPAAHAVRLLQVALP